MAENTTIRCPKCGSEFNVEDVIAHDIEEKYKDRLKVEVEEIENRFKSKEESLSKEKARLKELQGDLDRQVEERLKAQVAITEERIREQISREVSLEIEDLRNQNKEASDQINELKNAKLEAEKLKRQLESQKQDIEIEFEKKMNDRLREESTMIKKREIDRVELQLKERDQIINTLKDQLDEMKRKAEQGSVQLQGEVQEIAIEEWLSNQFPLDTILEVKKGSRGADCLQTINTRELLNCGTIYYESKRTKEFSNPWIEKFKADMRAKGANIGLLVTDALPKDMDRMGLRDGIWICTYDEFKGLCHVLRESVIAISSAIASQDRKGDKAEMLYEYLTGNEFRMSAEAIVEAFTQMKSDLDSEKRAIMTQWKKREKQIDKVLENTTQLFGSIRGIAGKEIGTIPALELSGDTEQQLLTD